VSPAGSGGSRLASGIPPMSAPGEAPQGKSEDQPHAKQIAPAEGVTPPAEVHACPTVHSAPCTTRYRCLPTGVTGSRSGPTPPGFGLLSFAATTLSIVGWIYDPDHSLRPGMYVDVPHLDCLLVAAPTTLEGLDHLILKRKKFDRVVAVNVDEVLLVRAPHRRLRCMGNLFCIEQRKR
jgi:hypothetical protein